MDLKNKEPNSWFEEWFDTKYYHLLYQHRDDNEARLFIDALFQYLKPSLSAHVLDLACGRGRHARYLHTKGVEVTGLDLAETNIEYAAQFSSSKLHFKVADMRANYGEAKFDVILNLFTSFGYFENWEDNLLALQQVRKALKPGGYFLIDFLNVDLVKRKLNPTEVRNIEGYQFNINRSMNEAKILKTIDLVEPDGKEHHFKEEIWALSLADFQQMFKDCNLEILELFGSYNLAKFDPQQSERLIMLARA